MNSFGGNWTENKIDILIEYAKAYLKIMNKFSNRYKWNLLYFDGFAGSGLIENKEQIDGHQSLFFDLENAENGDVVGAAKRILEINDPISFDSYYFVELDKVNYQNLIENTKNAYPSKDIHVVQTDCNLKMLDMSKYLKSKKGKNTKVLAYIDPYGMQLEWKSLEALKDVSVDMWILIPTGMGVNRLITSSGEISEAWLKRLVKFLGMSIEDLRKFFYDEKVVMTLFGEQETQISKKDKAINRSAELYQKRLKELFKYVSNSYMLKNKSNSVMFHFLMVSNNPTAVKIADEIIKKYKFNK